MCKDLEVISTNVIPDAPSFKTLMKIVNSHERQDVNQYINGDDRTILVDYLRHLFDENKLKKLAEVCPINLIQNVDMHNDTRFLKQMGYSPKVYFLVLKTTVKRPYVDSPHYNVLICGSSHIDLESNTMYAFNANKYHGVMVDNKLLGITLFFKR